MRSWMIGCRESAHQDRYSKRKVAAREKQRVGEHALLVRRSQGVADCCCTPTRGRYSRFGNRLSRSVRVRLEVSYMKIYRARVSVSAALTRWSE